MMNIRKRNSSEHWESFNLDSLVDIVSNSVGILIILAAFMAIFSFLKSTPQTTPDIHSIENKQKILIPWAHYSQKTALLYLIRDNRILRLDRSEYYKKLSKQLHGPNPLPSKSLNFDTHTVDLKTYGGQRHCLEFHPNPGAGLWWHQFTGNQKPLETAIRNFSSEEFYFFFWVAPNSFEIFRELRQTLWSSNFEVGWKPVREKSTLSYCSGYSMSQSFRPQ